MGYTDPRITEQRAALTTPGAPQANNSLAYEKSVTPSGTPQGLWDAQFRARSNPATAALGPTQPTITEHVLNNLPQWGNLIGAGSANQGLPSLATMAAGGMNHTQAWQAGTTKPQNPFDNPNQSLYTSHSKFGDVTFGNPAGDAAKTVAKYGDPNKPAFTQYGGPQAPLPLTTGLAVNAGNLTDPKFAGTFGPSTTKPQFSWASNFQR